MSETREVPILFSASMVRAILAGRKTQTRRILKPQPVMRGSGDCVITYERGGHTHSGPADYLIREIMPSYGCRWRVGDRLWVRETFSYDRLDIDRDGTLPPWYWADGNPPAGDWTKPKPSIHMPRCYSRITLEVTALRVERLQEITEDDACAEGLEFDPHGGWSADTTNNELWAATPRAAFASLWSVINGGRSWIANPWVSVTTFRRIT